MKEGVRSRGGFVGSIQTKKRYEKTRRVKRRGQTVGSESDDQSDRHRNSIKEEGQQSHSHKITPLGTGNPIGHNFNIWGNTLQREHRTDKKQNGPQKQNQVK